MMPSKAPTRQWADKPMHLVTTPRYETGKTDIFSTGATHLGLVNNTLIRGFNSIYLQAAHLQETDKEDFVGYSLAWYRFLKSHHADQDTNLFPKIEQILGDNNIFTETYQERQLYMPGLEEYYLYLSSLQTPLDFAGGKLVRIMESFRQLLEEQLHHEVTTIAALATHPHVPFEGSPELKAATSMWKSWAKNTVSKAGMTDIVPFFLQNLDRTFEGGLWHDWPPWSAATKWSMLTLAGSWNGGWWVFTSCDSHGKPQQLHALLS